MYIENENFFNLMLYFFTTIDVFTKMAWVYPMKENKCAVVMKCFKDILRQCGDNPERLNTNRAH